MNKKFLFSRLFHIGFFSLALAVFAGCGGGTDGDNLDKVSAPVTPVVSDTATTQGPEPTTTAADTTVPKLKSSSPGAGAKDIPVENPITVAFSEAMSSKTTLTVRDDTGSKVEGNIKHTGDTIVFTPKAVLQYATRYTVTLGTATDLSGNPLGAHTFTFTTVADTIAPTITSSTPAINANDIPVNSAIILTFSEGMITTVDADGINITTFTVNDGASDIGGKVSFTGTTATFTPDAVLQGNTEYTVTLSGTVADLAGNPLGASHTFTFRTGTVADTVPPEVTTITPSDGQTDVPVGTAITLNFSEAMAASGLTFTVSDADGQVAGEILPGGETVTFTPTADLQFDTAYTVNLKETASDLAGNSLATAHTFTFTTVADTTPPSVESSLPSLGATNVPVNALIALNFSEVMDSASISDATFTVKDATGATVTGEVTYDGVTVSITPATDLKPDTLYTVTLERTASDLAGNLLTGPDTFPFQTGSAPDNSPPDVVSTSPTDGAINVPTNKPIVLTFTEAMNVASITPTDLTVSDGTNTIPGTVTNGGTSVTFTPSGPLKGNTTYTVTLPQTATDMATNPLQKPVSFSFKTGNDTARPNFRFSEPVTGQIGVSIDRSVNLHFNEEMDVSTFTSSTFKLEDSLGNEVDGNISASGVTVTFNPSSDLEFNTSYTVTLACSVTDPAGNRVVVKDFQRNAYICTSASELYRFSFITATAVKADEAPPTLKTTNPSDYAEGIYVTDPIIMEFSEEMDASTINSSNIVVNDGTSNISGSFSKFGNSVIFSPDADLDYDTFYTVTVSGKLTDLVGKKLGADDDPERFRFTTTLPGYVSNLSDLPDTGQMTSYTDTFGEDSDYTISSPSYSTSDGETVKDEITKLTWQKQNDSTKRTWEEAVSYCDNLSIGGRSDWRLPTVFELESITDSEKTNPATASTYFPGTSSTNYWSYTTRAGHTAFAWFVNFLNGHVNYHYKSGSLFHVRCVRSGQ